MTAIDIGRAQAELPALVHQLAPGEEVVITENGAPVARLVAEPPPAAKPRQPGTLRGTVLYMAPDFDAPLDEFKEYMP
jgi:antitoxin (DNA-binding transcriptional repressor) of toxin-antitoxin stability system